MYILKSNFYLLFLRPEEWHGGPGVNELDVGDLVGGGGGVKLSLDLTLLERGGGGVLHGLKKFLKPLGEVGGPVTRNLVDEFGEGKGSGLEIKGGGGAVKRTGFGKVGEERGEGLEMIGGGGAGGISGGSGEVARESCGETGVPVTRSRTGLFGTILDILGRNKF